MKRTAILLVAALALTGGCIENPSPEEALLVVDGEAGKEVRIIISSRFVASVDQQQRTTVVLIEADTVVTTLPFQRRMAIDQDQRFFAETSRLESDLQNVHMEVRIDSDVEFAEGGSLHQGSPFRFVYAFNQFITREIVVL